MATVWLDAEMALELNLWRNYRSTPGTRLILHLFTNPAPVINDDIDCSALTEPVFTGYAAATIPAWAAPVEDEPGARWKTVATSVQFCRTVAGAPVTVYGVFFTSEDDGRCCGANLAWPDGIVFTTECDCYMITATKTEKDEVVVT